MRITSVGAAIGIAALVGVAACGGDDDSGATAPSTAPARTATASADAPAASEIELVRRRLEEAGYEPETVDVSGRPIAGVEVSDVDISTYRSARDAAAERDEVQEVFDGAPGRGVVRVVGTRMYFMAQERPLTPAERAEFNRIVNVAEGR